MPVNFKFLSIPIASLAGSLLILVAGAAYTGQQPAPDSAAAPSCCKVHQVSESDASSNLRKTLDPMQFTGEVREAYKIAQENPDLLVQLHCWCGCDRTNGHKNLLDCYRDHHGASCAICTGEALEAKKLFDQGASIETIRAALKARYAGNSN
ncbi:MAG: CYCXC family (seleno)protein [Candidatus Binataceae bacterium]